MNKNPFPVAADGNGDGLHRRPAVRGSVTRGVVEVPAPQAMRAMVAVRCPRRIACDVELAPSAPERARPAGPFPAVCMSFQRSDLSGGRSRTGTTSRPKALTVRRKRRKIQLGTRRDHAPGHGHPSPRRAEWTAPLRPTTVQQAGRPDGNWFSCDLVSPVVARCTAAGSPHGNQKSAGIRSTCPGWMRFGSPMMSRFASRIGPNPVPMYSGSDAAIPDKVSPDWTTCSR
jgi:hypothetical protein